MNRNINTRFSRRLESIFWWFLRLFPLIFCLFFEVAAVRGGNPEYLNISAYIENTFGYLSSSFVYTLFDSIFGAQGFLPFFDSASGSGFFTYLSWLVLVELSRFFITFLLWIVRFATRLLENSLR